MKIIKEGTPKSQRSVQLTCPECGCVFEATKEEFTFKTDQREGDYWKIECPTNGCGNTVYKYSW